MRIDFIDEAEAPPRLVGPRGGRRRVEMDELLSALAPGQVARVSPVGDLAWEIVASVLLEAAANAGLRVQVWNAESDSFFVRALEPIGDAGSGDEAVPTEVAPE